MPTIPGKNKYGNEAFDYAANVILDSNDLRKINWTTMDNSMFRKYLESSEYLWINKKY